MPRKTLSQSEIRRIDQLVNAYLADMDGRKLVGTFLDNVHGFLKRSLPLARQIHSIKTREKDPEHLRRKLERKCLTAAISGRKFDITPENFFVRINDLAGIRLLHLHTKQFEEINKILCGIFHEQNLTIDEGPTAKSWDDEYREYFRKIDGVEVEEGDKEDNKLMYTSVHYVIGSASKTKLTCEIQVRTLGEEIWGEVSHDINYPTPTENVACQEQIKTLARATSTATRLVDSIYATLKTENPSAARSGRRSNKGRKVK